MKQSFLNGLTYNKAEARLGPKMTPKDSVSIGNRSLVSQKNQEK